jgi:hypothetical protein
MNLVAHDPRQPVEICGFSIPVPGCVIHFYYSVAERRRFASFVAEGIAAGDAGILACTREAYDALADALQLAGIGRNDRRLVRLEIVPDLPSTIANIAQAINAETQSHYRRTRLLADFGCIVGPESIFWLDGLLSSALRGLNVISITQYNGRGFAASETIEQFQTHALAIIGNAICKENRNYTPPEKYIEKRAASAKA